MKWYTSSLDESVAELKATVKTKLSSQEASQRFTQYGPNELVGEEKTSALVLLLNQLNNPLIIILVVGAILSLYTGHIVDAIAIGVIVIINIAIFLDPGAIDEMRYFLRMSAGCNDASLVTRDGVPGIQGTPTEGALAVVSAKAGITKQKLIEDGAKLIHSFPFDSSRKLMSIVIQGRDGKHYVVAKGAPDIILKRSDQIYLHGHAQPQDGKVEQPIHDAIARFSSNALRTLAIAYKPIAPEYLQLTQEDYERSSWNLP